MKIVFYDSLPTIWLIAIILVFITYSFFVLRKNKSQWIIYFVLLTVRAIALALIILFFYKPVLQYNEIKSSTQSIPIFIDNSLSMNNDLEVSDRKNLKAKYLYYKELISNNFLKKDINQKINFELYTYNDGKIVELTPGTPTNGIFNINQWLVEQKNTSNNTNSSVILFSDLNFNVNKKELNNFLHSLGLKKKVYVVYEDEKVIDSYIESVNLMDKGNNGYQLSFKFVKHGDKPINVTFSLFDNDKNIFKKNYLLDKKENLIILPEHFKFKNDTILKAYLNPKITESNMLNNYYYFKVKGKNKAKKVHILFMKPSFELSFLRKTLRELEDYNIKVYTPTHTNKNIRLDSLSTNDKVIIGNLDDLDTHNAKILNNFVMRGGFLIFLKGNSRLDKLIKGNILQILPFTYAKSNMPNTNYTLEEQLSMNLTSHGKKYYFLNFRDINLSSKIWGELPIFSPIEGTIKAKEKSIILSTLNNKPAIIHQKVNKGIVMAILADPLWKIDFFNRGFGIQTNYYDQFWDELIKLNENEIKDDKIRLSKEICELNEKLTIYLSSAKFKLDDILIVRNEKGNHQLKLEKSGNQILTRFSCNQIGENNVILKSKNMTEKKLGKFYVNYPLQEQFQHPNELRLSIANIISKMTNGKIVFINKLDNEFLNILKNKAIEYKIV
ncbi:MAG: hypothetical protein OEV44_07420, partial [Spirochaetota bacterium]|nr:hypothetical protein [Spirochaetota bacterium]